MAVVSLGTDILHDVVNWQPRAGTHIIDMIPLIDVKRGTINAQNSRAIKSLYSSLKEITPSCRDVCVSLYEGPMMTSVL